MDQQWRSLYGQHNTKLITGNDGNGTEVLLAAFSGKCHNCHQVGHKAADCPHKRNTSKGNKNKCKCCSHCGKMGHVEANCWNQPENSNKCPKWYKPPCINGNEQSNVAVDDGDIDQVGDLLCMAIKKKLAFPSITELLKDPCVWIGDTATTKYITPHIQGMQNMKQDKSGTGITMGNDTVAKGTHTSNLPGICCDHQGNQLDNIVLTNVSVVPSSAFNLFSITKMQLGFSAATRIACGLPSVTILQEYDRNKCDPNHLLNSKIILHKLPEASSLQQGTITTNQNFKMSSIRPSTCQIPSINVTYPNRH